MCPNMDPNYSSYHLEVSRQALARQPIIIIAIQPMNVACALLFAEVMARLRFRLRYAAGANIKVASAETWPVRSVIRGRGRDSRRARGATARLCGGRCGGDGCGHGNSDGSDESGKVSKQGNSIVGVLAQGKAYLNPPRRASADARLISSIDGSSH